VKRHVSELVNVVLIVTCQFGRFGELLEFLDELLLRLRVEFGPGFRFDAAPSWEVFVPELCCKKRGVVRWRAGEGDESAFSFVFGEG
jgi:hypothetical protein